MTYNEIKQELQLDASTITDASNRYLITNFSNITRDNMSTISNYINSQIYPILKTLTSAPIYDDVLSVGLNGSTIISDHLANVNSGPIFWDNTTNTGRPKTLKESLLYIQGLAIGNQTIIQYLTDTNLLNRISLIEENVGNIADANDQQDLNLQQIVADTFGAGYQLNNNGNANRSSPIVDSFIPIEQRGSADGVATLDSNGKVPISQIPNLAITSVQIAGSIEERDIIASIPGALQVGDVVKTLEENKVFMVQSIINGVFNWIEIGADVQDLSDYARKSQSNIFTAKNIFKNDSENEILSVQKGNDVIAQFLKNEKILNLFNFSVGRNPLDENDKGFSEFYGEADFLTNKLRIGTFKDGPNSSFFPIEIYYDGKIRLNSFSSIKKKVSDPSLPISDQYLISVNTNQSTTEHAYIIKVGQDQLQESQFDNYLKHDGNTQTFKIARDPSIYSSDQSLATTNWVKNIVANNGGNIDTSNFAKLNTNNIYDTNVTNHFKGLIKSDRIIQLNDADQAYIKRQHLGSELNYTPLLYVEEDLPNDILADKRTILISIERENGANTSVDAFPAQIYWSEDPNIGPNDVSWKLSHTPHTTSNDTSIATTEWVLQKVNEMGGESVDPLIKNNIIVNEQLKFKDIIGPSIVLNYDTTTLESANHPNPVKNAIIQVYRGSNGTAAELKWNEEDDNWEISPPPDVASDSNAIATTYWTNAKINALSLNSLSDVTLNDQSLNNNQTLRYLNGQWVNVQLSTSNLSDSTNIALKNSSNTFTQIQRATSPLPDSNSTDLATTSWVRSIINNINNSVVSNLNDLSDVVITNPQSSQVLVYRNVNGTNQWINSTLNINEITGLNLSSYAPINSPSFTGSPSLNAQATVLPAEDSTARLVTSNWVQNLITNRLSSISAATFDGIMLDKTLSFEYSNSNVSTSIEWNFDSSNHLPFIFKFLNKTDNPNHPIALDEYFNSRFVVSTNQTTPRLGYQYLDNQLPNKGNYSHSLFYNSMDNWIYNSNNDSIAERSRYIVSSKVLSNNGSSLVEDPAIQYISYSDDIFASAVKFCYINPYLKDFFLLADNTFFSKGIFDGQKLFVKNVTNLPVYVGINSCDEMFNDTQTFNTNQNQRRIFTIPSKGSIEFVWLAYGSVNKDPRTVTGFWYPKVVNGNVINRVPANIAGGVFPPEQNDVSNKFATKSIYNIAIARKQT